MVLEHYELLRLVSILKIVGHAVSALALGCMPEFLHRCENVLGCIHCRKGRFECRL